MALNPFDPNAFPDAPPPIPAPTLPTSPSATSTDPLAALGIKPTANGGMGGINSATGTTPPPGTGGGFGGPVDCPTDQEWNGYTCVPKQQTPPPTTPPPAGPGNCPEGQVWRTDTNQCEAPDARHNAGQDTCGGQLPNCPPGQGVWCDFDTATFKCARNQWSDQELCDAANKNRAKVGKPPADCASLGYGGAGGGGGGGGKGAAPIGPSANSSAFDQMLQDFIKGQLNAPSRYTPEALQSLYGEVARQADDAITRGSRAVQADAARRGMSRAGATGAALRGVQSAAESQRGQAMVGIQVQKINADHQDKMDALDRAQKYLDSLRDSEYRYALLGEQRRQFDANLALGYANLTQQRQMLQMQLQSAWDMLSAQQGFYLLMQGT